MNTTKCSKCGAEIKFIRTSAGRWMPVNAQKVYYSLGGKDAIVTPEGYVVTGTISSEPMSNAGYIPHWATCKHADEFRRPKVDNQQELF